MNDLDKRSMELAIRDAMAGLINLMDLHPHVGGDVPVSPATAIERLSRALLHVSTMEARRLDGIIARRIENGFMPHTNDYTKRLRSKSTRLTAVNRALNDLGKEFPL